MSSAPETVPTYSVELGLEALDYSREHGVSIDEAVTAIKAENSRQNAEHIAHVNHAIARIAQRNNIRNVPWI